jgi:hypothetical protein
MVDNPITLHTSTYFHRRQSMKTIVTTLAVASLIATAAVAKTNRANHVDRSDIYQSDSLGYQSYPNPDRGPYPSPRGSAYY